MFVVEEHVVIHQSFHKVVLTELYREHMRVSHMKALAHSLVWWKRLDKDLEELGSLAILTWL